MNYEFKNLFLFQKEGEGIRSPLFSTMLECYMRDC